MREGPPRGIREKIVEPIKKLVVETQLKHLDLSEFSFDGLKEILLKDEPGTAYDLLVSPRGLAMMQRLANLHNKTIRKAQSPRKANRKNGST